MALAALEPHFAKALCAAIGLNWTTPAMMLELGTRQAIAKFAANRTRKALEKLAAEHDIPLHTLSK
jgi:hypothetical protein